MLHKSVIKIWNFEEGKEIRTLRGYNNFIWSVFATPDGKYIVSGSKGGVIKIWNFDSGDYIRRIKQKLECRGEC